MLCKNCPHFRVRFEPLKDPAGIWDYGKAKCDKHGLIVEFPDYGSLDALTCLEHIDVNGKEEEDEGDECDSRGRCADPVPAGV